MIKKISLLCILLSIILGACAEKEKDFKDYKVPIKLKAKPWSYVPCNGTTPNCGRLDDNIR